MFAFKLKKFFKQKQDIRKFRAGSEITLKDLNSLFPTLLTVFGRWLQILLLNFGFYFGVAVEEVQKLLT